MRRPRVYSASSSASNVAPTASPVSTLPLIRLLAVASIIGSQFHGARAITLANIEATSTATNTQNTQNNSSSTEKSNFYFDAFNTTRTISSTAVDLAATTLYVSQTPAEITTTTPPTDNTSPLLLYTASSTRSYQSKTSIKMHAGIESSSMSIKNPSTGAFDQLPAGLTTAAATLKSARANSNSNSIQPNNDSTRSRSHWVVGVIDSERPRTFRSKHHHEHHWGPFFEEPLNSAATGDNLVSTAHLFTEAVLNCRVGMLKDKTVMWVRRTTEKVSLLTVGNVTYSGDPRIRVKFQYPNNWRLLINPTQRDDAGIYMCQVSTHPPRVFTTNLTILEPPLRVIDENERDVGDRYYKAGSTVDLQCQVSRSFFQKERYSILKSTDSENTAKLNHTASELNLIGDTNLTNAKLSSQALDKYFTYFIIWAKDDEPLQALTNKRSSVSDKWLNSRISIPDARLSDSGNYSCSLGRLFTVIVQVQVLTGELPAAVQHNLAAIAVASRLTWLLFTIAIFFGILRNLST